MTTRAQRDAVLRQQAQIRRLQEKNKALREELRVLRLHEKWAREEEDRHEQGCDEVVKALWVMHAILGYPPIKDGEMFTDVILRELVKRTGSKIDWKRILRGDSIAVARAVAMLDPNESDERKQELLAEEEQRQKFLRGRGKLATWMKKVLKQKVSK
jgi:hypothetical protein